MILQKVQADAEIVQAYSQTQIIIDSNINIPAIFFLGRKDARNMHCIY